MYGKLALKIMYRKVYKIVIKLKIKGFYLKSKKKNKTKQNDEAQTRDLWNRSYMP